MARRALRLLIIGASAAALYISPAFGEIREIKGIVVTNQNGQLTVKTPAGDQVIGLGADVRVRSISGPLGGQKEEVPVSALIPGLPVSIEADDASGQLVASAVDYKASDYKTAAQIQAGVQETARREEELRSAYSKVGQWDVRAEKSVYFKTGSSTISAGDKKELLTLAKEAAQINGYVISVLGYADPTGNAAANERLSNQRAQNVINYLKQSGTVLPGKVLAASAMGEVELNGASDPKSYSSARRVTVRVLTSKALLQQQ